MTNYNERLDEILLSHGAEQGEFHYSLKRAITSLIKELVAEARIDELEHCCGKCGVWHSETCNISQGRLTFRERINELKQELEKL